MLTKKEADNLIKTEGESRGVNMKIDLDYLIEKKGELGLKEVERRMTKLGHPLKYKDINPMSFYPLGLEATTLLCIVDFLGLDDKGLEQMGKSVVKFSIFMKILMKYFGSLKMISKEVPKTWKEHYTVGSLEMTEFSDNHVLLVQKDFKVHPIYCSIHKGYFKKVAQMVVKSEITSKETKCVFKNDDHNEFLLTWE